MTAQARPAGSARGLLLVNLGTPDAPTEDAVRTYLHQFLMDPDVIDVPWPLRWWIVSRILRKRPADSAALYRKIWTAEGSPLLLHHEELVRAVAARLGPDGWCVAGGMRYGNPSIETGLRALAEQGARAITVFPLYPQFSQSATASSLAEAKRAARRAAPDLELKHVPEFHADAAFLDAFAARGRAELENFAADHVLFSFHGLPARQVAKQVRRGLGDYREQCYATARGIASRLGLEPARFTVCFQSRLDEGWIRPFTDELYRTLPARGAKRVAVFCPAFVADCLETLEEVAIRGREEFRAHGGEELRLVPSLNAMPAWVETVARIATGKP